MLEVVLGNSAYGARLIATKPITAGQLVHSIREYQVTTQPSYRSIQVGVDSHIEELGIIAYLNHSCQPNTLVNTTTFEVYAVRSIAPGEELTFFYPSTEWEMDRPFICLCSAPQCVRVVAGAKYLSVDTLSRHFINQHIREMIRQTLEQRILTDALVSVKAE
ncbi:MAG: SET domain-containing protein-lysine N-methyltransferase [Caldilineaceae bacterium]